jgi:tRNA modification GTPase
MTIASIITAPGEAAVAIIKISGKDSWIIAEKLTNKNFKHRYLELAWIKNEAQENLDQCLILPFRAPHSYTGEDLIEIHSHGGIWVSEKILELVLNCGARLAKAGEFTERAFLNHKLDLSQAEAILDIIQARSSGSSENAIKLYQGYLGIALKEIREALLNLLGEVTASIDFPDEVGAYDREKFNQRICEVNQSIEKLLEGEREGHILRYGYKVALVGNPNAGKSTLLNTLLKRERAIVTEIAGTTRDVIEESYSIKGLPIVLLDTAGIRTSEDTVERIGIQRSHQAIKEADLVLYLVDLSDTDNHLDSEIYKLVRSKNHLVIGNKSDLQSSSNTNADIKISSLKQENIEELKELIYKCILEKSSTSNQVKINHRQADLLRKAKTALEHSLQASKHEAEDFWTIDLRAAIAALGEITGETLTEELLDNIFSRFCIGK